MPMDASDKRERKMKVCTLRYSLFLTKTVWGNRKAELNSLLRRNISNIEGFTETDEIMK